MSSSKYDYKVYTRPPNTDVDEKRALIIDCLKRHDTAVAITILRMASFSGRKFVKTLLDKLVDEGVVWRVNVQQGQREYEFYQLPNETGVVNLPRAYKADVILLKTVGLKNA